ncbi:hypothetical protein EW146_g7322 [Bondarzewia mesenterica]|uniref:Histone deacetylase complex subunit SAP30 Sin3 binding domain-containing protein n=1 Tax=Bondarzewia mesenterica TaxID=1095465 RepID=A0A4S4LMX2_9AGAM|nr:hypothetical protein EW146_g7322 [Bondarzewia mesenterica]
MSAMMNTTQPSNSRSRNQARRRQNDDAAYMGPSSAGGKRQAGDKAEGEPRVKRKRVDAAATGHIGASAQGRRGSEDERRASIIDFGTLPKEALHRYLNQYDLIPHVYPSPLTALDPPPPSSLLQGPRSASRGLSPAVSITPANRPRRGSREQSRRRSSRLAEEEVPRRTPILGDVGDVERVLATIAQAHFESNVVKEGDTLAAFMGAPLASRLPISNVPLTAFLLPVSHSPPPSDFFSQQCCFFSFFSFKDPFPSPIMKFSAISSLVVLLPLFAQSASAAVFERQNNRFGGFGRAGNTANNKGGNNAANNNNKGNTNKGNAAASTTAASSAAAAASTTAAAAANSGNLQTSLTLDNSVLATGFESNGQETPTAGQSASLTSSNNFINFCATVPGKPITNGQQIKTGSCNPAPMGIIAATTNMPSSKFVFPKNTDTSLQANTAFTIQMAIQNIQTGTFTNAQANYYSAPQQVNAQGSIIGHTHVVIEALTSLDQTTPTNPNVFAFFKGINEAASNGIVTADVTSGLPAGVYKISSINAAANHQPVLVAVAQHGSLDDVAYFTVGGAGAGAAAGGKAASNSTAAATSASAAAASTASAAAGKGTGTNKGNVGTAKGKTGRRSRISRAAY